MGFDEWEFLKKKRKKKTVPGMSIKKKFTAYETDT